MSYHVCLNTIFFHEGTEELRDALVSACVSYESCKPVDCKYMPALVYSSKYVHFSLKLRCYCSDQRASLILFLFSTQEDRNGS